MSKQPTHPDVAHSPVTLVSRDHAARMLIDLSAEMLQSSPAGAWLLGPDRPGSRRCIQQLLTSTAHLWTRPIPHRVSGRRADFIAAVNVLSQATRARSSWSSSTKAERMALLHTLYLWGIQLPANVQRMIVSGRDPLTQPHVVPASK